MPKILTPWQDYIIQSDCFQVDGKLKDGQGLIKTLSGFKNLMENFSKGGVGSVISGLFGGNSSPGSSGGKKGGLFGLWLQSEDIQTHGAETHTKFAEIGSLIGSVLDRIIESVKDAIQGSSGSSGSDNSMNIQQIVERLKAFFSGLWNSGDSESSHLTFHHEAIGQLMEWINQHSTFEYKDYLMASILELQSLPLKHESALENFSRKLGMNKEVLMHKLLRGNLELSLFVHSASDKIFARQYISDLYHFMVENQESPVTQARELGQYLILLRDIASHTEDLSLNEFLGSFDIMAEKIYYSS